MEIQKASSVINKICDINVNCPMRTYSHKYELFSYAGDVIYNDTRDKFATLMGINDHLDLWALLHITFSNIWIDRAPKGKLNGEDTENRQIFFNYRSG